MGRLITFPMPTLCAVNGHGFGAGFMRAFNHDIRLMRADRGFLCANEIQIGMAIPDAELALFRHKMSGSAFFDTVQLARQLASLGENRELFGRSKERIFGEGPAINDKGGAAHMLREGRRGG